MQVFVILEHLWRVTAGRCDMHDFLDEMFTFTKQGSNERSVSVFATVCSIHGSAQFCIFLVIATTTVTFPHHEST